MKVLVFLALVAFSQAAHLFYYAGTTNSTTGGTSPQANYAVIDTNGACTASATPSGYQMFTINSTANPGPTFYWVTALFEKTTVATAQVQVYNGKFAAATPCANITAVKQASSRAPHVSVLVYLPPGFHDVVVTTTDATDAGVFAVHADRAAWTAGTNSDSSPYMLQQYTGYSDCDSYSTASPYVYYSWAAAATSVIDIIVFSYNSTVINNNFVASLYNTSTGFFGTGNATNPVEGCTANWVDNAGEETSYTKISQDYFAAAIFVGVQQTVGVNYTIVGSGYNTGDNYIYGVFIRPSVQGFFGTTQNYYRPDFGSLQDGDICENGTSAYYWRPVVFNAQYNTYVVDNGNSVSGVDTAACLYYGNNEGSVDMTVAPVPCSANWLQCIDTGDVGPLHQLGTTPGRNYTVVQTTYSSGSGSGAEYMLYVYTGVQLGPLPITTTGVETTLAASSSSATMIVASLALIFAAFFF
jgi:hypothetical protein